MRLKRLIPTLIATVLTTSIITSTGLLGASAETPDYIISEGGTAASAWGQSVTITEGDFDKTVFQPNSAVFVEYESDGNPGAVEFIAQSWTDPNIDDGKVWAKIAPDSDDGKLAVFTYETIVEELETTFSSSLDYLNAYHISATDRDVTVTKAYIQYDAKLPPIEFKADDGVLSENSSAPTLSFDMSDWNKYIKVTPDGELTGISMSTVKKGSCQAASLMISTDLKEDITDKYPSFANRLRDADNNLIYPDTENEDAVFIRPGVELDCADFGLSTFDGCAIVFYCAFTEEAAQALLGETLYVYPSDDKYNVLSSTPTEIKIDTISKSNVGYYVKGFIAPAVGVRSTKIIFELSQIKAFSGDVALIDNIKIQAPTELIQYVSNVDGYNETAEIRLLASDKLVAGEKNKEDSKIDDTDSDGVSPILLIVAGVILVAIIGAVVVVLVVKSKNKYY